MDLSIIILAFNTKNLVRECVKNILRVAPRLRHEIIVVDNGSRDGTAETLEREFPGIIVIASRVNLGYGGGNNLGLRRATGRYVGILNPDVTISIGSLETLVSYMDAHPRVGLAGPRLQNADGSLQYSCFRWLTPTIPAYRRTPLGGFGFAKRTMDKFLMKDYDHASPRAVHWLMGAVLIARRSALTRVGMLDERYFLYVEDADWSRTFWQQGFEVHYVPEARMTHLHQRDSAQGNLLKTLLRRSSWRHIKSAVQYFWKWRNTPPILPANLPVGRQGGEEVH